MRDCGNEFNCLRKQRDSAFQPPVVLMVCHPDHTPYVFSLKWKINASLQSLRHTSKCSSWVPESDASTLLFCKGLETIQITLGLFWFHWFSNFRVNKNCLKRVLRLQSPTVDTVIPSAWTGTQECTCFTSTTRYSHAEVWSTGQLTTGRYS